MKKIDLERLESEIERKISRRQKRKKPRMRISGASVKKLRTIIIKKSKG